MQPLLPRKVFPTDENKHMYVLPLAGRTNIAQQCDKGNIQITKTGEERNKVVDGANRQSRGKRDMEMYPI